MDKVTLITIFFYTSLILPIFGVFFIQYSKNPKLEKYFLQYFSYGFVLFVFSVIAFRPIGDFGFPDTKMYTYWFNQSKINNTIATKDIGFGIFTFILSKLVSLKLFFVICTAFSFGLLFWLSRKIAGNYWFLFFLGTMVSLYFWNQHVFTIRQGLASVIFLTALFQRKVAFTFILFLISISFHKSFLLPFFCYLIIYFFKKTRIFISIWLISIPVSYYLGNEIVNFFSDSFSSDVAFYFPPESLENSNNTFRWDVVFYSLIFIIIPFLYKFKDKIYIDVVNLYILVNSIIIILLWPASIYIHRFAYLSWFLAPVILYYPLLKHKKIDNFSLYSKVLLSFYIMIVFYIGIKLFQQDFRFI